MNIRQIINYVNSFGVPLFMIKSIRRLVYKNNNKVAWYINSLNEKKVTNFLQENIDICDINLDNYLCCKKKVESEPIWIMWWQGEKTAPDIVKVCIQSIRNHSNGHKVYIIDKDNVSDYINIPEIIFEKYRRKIISRTHLSDVVRLLLLATYGGVWVDSTIYMMNSFDNEVFNSNFYTINFGEYTKDPSHGRWTTFMMAAKPNDILIKTVLKYHIKYWSEFDCLIDYIMFDYFVKLAVNSSTECYNQMNSIKINNQDVFLLRKMLNKKWISWNDLNIDNDTYLFKLSWKEKFEEKTSGNQTVYGYIKDECLS